MTTKTVALKAIRLDTITRIFKTDIVFTASLVLALASCVFIQPKLEYIDFRVLACLFNIMLAVKAFEELQLLEKLSVGILNRCEGSRKVQLVLIFTAFFTSMLFTNDVALLTLVPLALIIGRKSEQNMAATIIFQTLAANIGSSLTPMGNPQNLYIFSYYGLNAGQFFSTVGLFTAAGLVFLVILNQRTKNISLEVELADVKLGNKVLSIVWSLVFILIILSVFRLIDYRIAFGVTAATALLLNRTLLMKVDYRLLVTFICFFIFIGNISHLNAVGSMLKALLGSETSVYFGSIVLSQVISNVPSAILLSNFTPHWKELLLGVNIGGMGTIVASLASVISYKLYIAENPEGASKYLSRFSLYNISGLILFTVLNFLLLLVK
ncbi:MAG TPA: SLC13 family permease [Clostridia bacterium]|nr:SLC13 family permease [Clostridia bacterium]